jgi:predicted NAD/FAD-binding protein
MYKYSQTLTFQGVSMNVQRIAVIGGGISGLATAWLLGQRYTVRLFEREAVLGGHAHTVTIADPQGAVAIDTGFVVYNERNYPLLTRLFSTLGVVTQPTEMSFAYSLQPRGIEYAGSDLNTLFAQRRNLLRPRFMRMVADVLRFNRLGKRLLAETGLGDETLGAFLDEYRFGPGFIEDYLLPMAASIWSCPTETMRQFPARSFLEFFRNHGLLNIEDRPQWRTVVGGSQAYVQRLAAQLGPDVIRHEAVLRVERVENMWRTETSRSSETFDAVVFACHADEALAMLEEPTAEQASVLAACRFQDNRALLHTDVRLLPSSHRVWSSWNYLTRRQGVDDQRVSVSYYMNRLHALDRRTEYIISLNPWSEPHPTTLLGEYHWRHPILDMDAAAAQARLASVQGQNGVYMAGAWTGYGFHEDGMRSAVAVGRMLGVEPPWERSAAAGVGLESRTATDTARAA